MVISFFYLVFQPNPHTEKIHYWIDGKTTKQVMSKEKFLNMALVVNEGKLYSQIYDACKTYSFYMWNTVDAKVIHLTQRLEVEDRRKFKNNLVTEFNKARVNPVYSSQDQKEIPKLSSELMTLYNLGLEIPHFELIQGLNDSLLQDKKFSWSNLFTKKDILMK